MPVNKLIVFVKNEEAGKVKTRLAEDIGDVKALEVYRELLDYTCRLVRQLPVEKEVWYSRFIPKEDRWEASGFKKMLQKGEDLGDRMQYALDMSFKSEKRSKVVLIGSDCAELRTSIIEQAFQELDESDIVVGPARDGGYYLIGMSRMIPGIFEDIKWSTDKVLEKTLENIKNAGVDFAMLSELNDVDTLEDWKTVRELFEC